VSVPSPAPGGLSGSECWAVTLPTTRQGRACGPGPDTCPTVPGGPRPGPSEPPSAARPAPVPDGTSTTPLEPNPGALPGASYGPILSDQAGVRRGNNGSTESPLPLFIASFHWPIPNSIHLTSGRRHRKARAAQRRETEFRHAGKGPTALGTGAATTPDEQREKSSRREFPTATHPDSNPNTAHHPEQRPGSRGGTGRPGRRGPTPPAPATAARAAPGPATGSDGPPQGRLGRPGTAEATPGTARDRATGARGGNPAGTTGGGTPAEADRQPGVSSPAGDSGAGGQPRPVQRGGVQHTPEAPEPRHNPRSDPQHSPRVATPATPRCTTALHHPTTAGEGSRRSVHHRHHPRRHPPATTHRQALPHQAVAPTPHTGEHRYPRTSQGTTAPHTTDRHDSTRDSKDHTPSHSRAP
jgi:hypothetical protein